MTGLPKTPPSTVADPEAGLRSTGHDAPTEVPPRLLSPALSEEHNSITVTQLRSLLKDLPEEETERPDKPSSIYDKTDTLIGELDEFHSYAETRQWQDSATQFYKSGGDGRTEWLSLPEEEKVARCRSLLGHLSDSSQTNRVIAYRRLVYLIQGMSWLLGGCWMECSSTEEHLRVLVANNQLIRELGAAEILTTSLRTASDALYKLSNAPGTNGGSSQGSGRAGQYPVFTSTERACGEIELIMTMFYFQLETQRHSPPGTIGRDQKHLPLVTLLFTVVSRLMEKSTKGFPVKKLLLTLWKSLLVTFGSVEDSKSLMAEARKRNNLPPLPLPPHDTMVLKTRLHDYLRFQEEYEEKFAFVDLSNMSFPYKGVVDSFSSTRRSPPTPLTASIPSKRRFQAVAVALQPSEPTLFPFPDDDGDPYKPNQGVPRALVEAADLHHKHVYISLSAIQAEEVGREWDRVRRGLLPRDPASSRPTTVYKASTSSSRPGTVHSQKDTSAPHRYPKDTGDEIEDRFDRLDTFYRTILPLLSPVTLFLVKILVATMNAMTRTKEGDSGASDHHGGAYGKDDGGSSGRKRTMEEVDAARHREIMWKAVSAVLLLLLKTLKSSHTLQSEYVNQLLVDANILPLILKLFNQQETEVVGVAHNEIPSFRFMTYCTLREKPRVVSGASLDGPEWMGNEREGELSARNGFAMVNLLRVMQTLTKHRGHRISMLLQYKALAMLKKVLKLDDPLIQLYGHKLCKNLVPFCGRKWRQSNMKIISGIYLHCRQNLRDDWLMGGEPEILIEESQMQDRNLREIIRFYNDRFVVGDGRRRYIDRMEESLEEMMVRLSEATISSDTSQGNSRPISSAWEDVGEEDEVEVFDATFINNYERWLENEVFNITQEDLESEGESFFHYLPFLDALNKEAGGGSGEEERHVPWQDPSGEEREATDAGVGWESEEPSEE